MSFLALLLGALVGALIDGMFAAVVGGAMAFVVAELVVLRAKVHELEQVLAALRDKAPPPLTPMSGEPVGAAAPASARKPAAFAVFGDAPPAPRHAAVDASSTWLSRWATPAKRALSGGNTPVRVGVVLLFFGFAFLMKYAVEHGVLSVELRLLAAVAAGVALWMAGWRLRARRAEFALALQGGGIGILYLAVFAAMRLYGLLPPAAGFVLLVALALAAAALAVKQNAATLAVLGAVGGFLAPLLAAAGDAPLLLFGYYAVLNGGVLAVAWFRAWRLLNLTGFVFTFGVAAWWGYAEYTPDMVVGIQLFLALFVAVYATLPVLYALRQPPRLKGVVDATLVFGTPLVGFGMQAYLMQPYEYGLAISAVILGLLYLGAARGVKRRLPETLRVLADAFLALAVVFITVAVPLALDGRWTAAAWALEGAGMVWIGLRQTRPALRLVGIALQFAAALALLAAPTAADRLPVLNADYLGRVLLALAAFASGFVLYRDRATLPAAERGWSPGLLGWALLWWYGAGLTEIGHRLDGGQALHAALVFAAASATGAAWLGSVRRAWPALARSGTLLLPGMGLAMMLAWRGAVTHPTADAGVIAWPLAVVAHYLIMRRLESGSLLAARFGAYWHAAALWLVAALGGWECAWWVDRFVHGATTWWWVGWTLWPAMGLLLLMASWPRLGWPFSAHGDTYMALGAGPVLGALALWSVTTNLGAGDPSPLPFLPLANPLDLAQALVVVTAGSWRALLRARWPTHPLSVSRVPDALMAAIAFIWANAALLRTLHYWADVPYTLHGILHSVSAQASLSVFWAVLGVGAAVTATRRGWRGVWLVGAGLLGVDVVKLFLVDLANSGTVARFVSFIAVGVLLVLVGYFSPAPPRGDARTR